MSIPNDTLISSVPAAAELRRVICPKGETDADVLERIFRRYNDALPETYHGRSISASDVIELYGDGERRYFYREETSFTPVEFSPLLAKNMK